MEATNRLQPMCMCDASRGAGPYALRRVCDLGRGAEPDTFGGSAVKVTGGSFAAGVVSGVAGRWDPRCGFGAAVIPRSSRCVCPQWFAIFQRDWYLGCTGVLYIDPVHPTGVLYIEPAFPTRLPFLDFGIAGINLFVPVR